MDLIPELRLPFTNPVIIFSIVLFTILLAPQIFKRIKIPGIVGIIISGIILGPHGLNLLAMDSSFLLFGTVGLLYIMFLAGIELDFNEFITHKSKSLFYGLMLVMLSIALGLIVFSYILHYQFATSILLASIISTFTLVSYPIVSRLGLVQYKTMPITIGGVIIADLLALLILVALKTTSISSLNTFFILKLIVLISIYSWIVFSIFPKITKFAFRKIEPEGTWQFIFILAMLFLSCFLAELIGLEAIIGAFAAGISLNRLIPHKSILMERINFVGNAIFIPFFLIRVGMLINLSVIFQGTEVIFFAILLLSLSLIAKWLTAFIIQKSFRFSAIDRQFMFGLSISQAATLLAVALIGYNLHIISEPILNSTILVILLSSLISTFITENAGKKIVIQLDMIQEKKEESQQRILIPVANPNNIPRLVEFSHLIKDDNQFPILALNVLDTEDKINEKVKSCQKIINENAKIISHKFLEQIVVTAKINYNIADGIIQSAKENLITDIVVGLNPKMNIFSKIFGDLLTNLLDNIDQTVYVIKNPFPMNTIDKLFILLPENAEFEKGFIKTINTLFYFSKNSNTDIIFYGFTNTLSVLKKIRSGNNYITNVLKNHKDLTKINFSLSKDNMLIIVSSRNKGVSHNLFYTSMIEKILEKSLNNNLCVIYPEQNSAYSIEDIAHFDILDTSPINENLARWEKVTIAFKKLLQKIKVH
jgi:Kef-type K+ transport system membrane component KefB